MPNEKANWIKIKNEYINSNISYRDLAEKYGVGFSTLEKVARREKWPELRRKQCDKIATKLRQKTADKIVAKELSRLDRINSVADRLLDKMEEAIDQLNNHLVKNKKKTKVIEYKNSERPDKPTKETIEEIEEAEFVCGDIDRLGLKMLAGALKDVRGISQVDEGEDERFKERMKNMQTLAEMINNPRPNRNIRDFEEDE